MSASYSVNQFLTPTKPIDTLSNPSTITKHQKSQSGRDQMVVRVIRSPIIDQ